MGYSPGGHKESDMTEHTLYTGHLKADRKIGKKEGRKRRGPKGKWVRCREEGEVKQTRKSPCPFLFLPDLGFFLPDSSVIVKTKDWESRELMLLIPCIVLGILLLISLVFIAIILLRMKGKYGRCRVLGATGNAQG